MRNTAEGGRSIRLIYALNPQYHPAALSEQINDCVHCRMLGDALSSESGLSLSHMRRSCLHVIAQSQSPQSLFLQVHPIRYNLGSFL